MQARASHSAVQGSQLTSSIGGARLKKLWGETFATVFVLLHCPRSTERMGDGSLSTAGVVPRKPLVWPQNQSPRDRSMAWNLVLVVSTWLLYPLRRTGMCGAEQTPEGCVAVCLDDTKKATA